MKQAKRYIRIVLLMVFFKKKPLLLGNLAVLGPKIMHPHNSGSASMIFKKIFINERDQQVHKNHVDSFSKKILVYPKCVMVGLKKKGPRYSRFTLRTFL